MRVGGLTVEKHKKVQGTDKEKAVGVSHGSVMLYCRVVVGGLT